MDFRNDLRLCTGKLNPIFGLALLQPTLKEGEAQEVDRCNFTAEILGASKKPDC